METYGTYSDYYLRYLELLSKEYPTQAATFTEIINLQAIVNLPKGTEHFMSDLHGEYEAFYHILNNCSGVIREKVEMIFANSMTPEERDDLLTLIYYPKEKLDLLKRQHIVTDDWARTTLNHLIRLAKLLSSKYTRSKVRKAMPPAFRFVIDELLHSQPDEDKNRHVYHSKIFDTILETGSTRQFIYALANLIKRLAVDHLHIIGDIYDRGPHADKIMDNLMHHHSLDIQWGNHDVLWMGAAAGSQACIANVLRNNIRYHNMEILESGYGISLRPLALFALDRYRQEDGIEPMVKAINVILCKLEGQAVFRHPEYNMDDRLLFHKINLKQGTITLGNQTYPLITTDFPTFNPQDPYTLSPEEHRIMSDIQSEFLESERLQRHMRFLYSHGSLYRSCNNNLLFHGGVPLNADGSFKTIYFDGRPYKGREFMDKADFIARQAFEKRDESSLDYMWYMWCGTDSPVSGRIVKTFERSYIADKETWKEPQNDYYRLNRDKDECIKILHEFGIDSPQGHIINGHTPVKVKKGESPIRAEGREICIDGGFCKAYQDSTGIAGYTLIFNSHGIRIKAHYPFKDVNQVLMNNVDIDSESMQVEMEPKRVMIGDTDNGKKILQMIDDLNALLAAYRQGTILERAEEG
ncbi:fructose 1,6-bisphosphatase [Megasphaera cerevisiae DSM 20462]|uniref:Fructose-1,6-bisphosphatase class 3 n=1 Tax=Megasphaera cerevisiae DSM 20462 TaxID=1122219 RepID=A0A0J6WVE9_9FIRM|nr:fructose-bisphosphatase class III [Megasphaera cerevisiae]KMO86188.1 fructose 1,6-bisphosphatase [Megasphaera cerevisiae DSM 20462]SKA16233.1 fructose-1,6-bisphosphatase-3 [Megasphaera cerevisiae DSM 20462]